SAYASNGGATSYYEPDALGSTDALLDDAGSETDRYAYRAYGLASHTQGTSANDFDWVGKLGYFRDSEIDLYLLRARYYDPLAARFISEDPIGYRDDIHLYRYARNNPVLLTDPSGKAIVIHRDYRHPDGTSDPGNILGDNFYTATSDLPEWRSWRMPIVADLAIHRSEVCGILGRFHKLFLYESLPATVWGRLEERAQGAGEGDVARILHERVTDALTNNDWSIAPARQGERWFLAWRVFDKAWWPRSLSAIVDQLSRVLGAVVGPALGALAPVLKV